MTGAAVLRRSINLALLDRHLIMADTMTVACLTSTHQLWRNIFSPIQLM